MRVWGNILYLLHLYYAKSIPLGHVPLYRDVISDLLESYDPTIGIRARVEEKFKTRRSFIILQYQLQQ